MSASSHYSDPAAFRMALERRLRAQAQASGLPVNRLRKEAAFNRLLARLRQVAPGMWALKGGLALIARVGLDIRGTRDADANWRATLEELENLLSIVEELDLGDWFSFQIGDGRPLRGEGEHHALRYPATARLAGRVFEQLTIDLNLVGSHDSRSPELVRFKHNAFAFVGEPPLEVPMIRPAHQLAEKLHAYTRTYDGETSSRAKDLFDMLVIADQVVLPDGSELLAAAQETFRIRSTAWPPELHPPPRGWVSPWQAFVADHPLRWGSLAEAYAALKEFWEPVLTGAAAEAELIWQPRNWMWAELATA